MGEKQRALWRGGEGGGRSRRRCPRPSIAAAAVPRRSWFVPDASLQLRTTLQARQGAGAPTPCVLAHLDGCGGASSAVLGGRAAHRPLGAGAGADRRSGAGGRGALHYRMPALLLVSRKSTPVPKEGSPM